MYRGTAGHYCFEAGQHRFPPFHEAPEVLDTDQDFLPSVVRNNDGFDARRLHRIDDSRIGEDTRRAHGVMDAIEPLADPIFNSAVQQKDRDDEDPMALIVRCAYHAAELRRGGVSHWLIGSSRTVVASTRANDFWATISFATIERSASHIAFSLSSFGPWATRMTPSLEGVLLMAAARSARIAARIAWWSSAAAICTVAEATAGLVLSDGSSAAAA